MNAATVSGEQTRNGENGMNSKSPKTETRGRKPKKALEKRIREASIRQALGRTRAKGIFEEALSGERFGPHPGQVDLAIQLSVYNAVTQRREDLPGKKLELLVSNIDEVDDIVLLTRQVLSAWIAGIISSPNQGE